MSQPDRRTESGRVRRLLARVAVVAGATVAGTSAAVVIGSGLSVAEGTDGGVLGPVQDRVVEVADTVEPTLEQAEHRLPALVEEVPAVVEDVARPGVELPSTPLPDVEPVLEVPEPETLPAPDVPEPELPDPAPHEPEAPERPTPDAEVPEHAVPAPPPPAPEPAVPAVSVEDTAVSVEDTADAPTGAANSTAPEAAVDNGTDEPVSPLPSRFGTAPAPPATGSTVDWPGTPSVDRTAGLRTAPAHDAGTTTSLRTAAQHVSGAPRPQPGTTPD